MKSFVLHCGPGAPAYNMALDEALLEVMPRLQMPVLRFYGWTEPAATFGYFQHYAEVARATLLRPLIRRPTGGGIVPHDADWTYSLAFPPGHEWYRLRAEESYRRAHEWLQTAFAKLGVNVALAAERKVSLPGQCFVGHEKFDVLWHGKKIAGAAQRRNQLGLLIQGSVQPPVGVLRGDWEAAMQSGAENVWRELPLDDAVFARAQALAAGKYSQAAFNERR
jgi:lipoate-protein ligase A